MSRKKDKVSFLFYYDYLEQFEELTAEEIVDMIKSIVLYERDNVEPKFEDRTLRTTWNFIKRRLDIDKTQYKKTCERNKRNIEERWKKKILGLDTDDTCGINGKEIIPHSTIDTDIDTHIDKDINLCVINEEEQKEEFCHLSRKTKIEACKDCLKADKCPLKTNPTFELEKGCTFEEWMKKRSSVSESIVYSTHHPPDEDKTPLFNYNWLEEDTDE